MRFRKVALILSLAASLGAQVRITGKVQVSGKVQARAELCTPNSTQLSNRTSTAAIALPTPPALPSPGGSYCDPTYGYQVARVSDNTDTNNSIAVLGQVGFNKNSTRIATIITGGLLRVYSFNQTTMVSGGGTTIWPIANAAGGAAVGFNTAAFFWSLSSDSDAADTVLIADGMSIYKINVTSAPVSGNYQAYKIADLSGMNLSSVATPALQRCTASSDTAVIGCAIMPTTGSEPSIFSRVGYVIFRLLSQSTASPTTNYTVINKFVNGVDSANLDTNRTVTNTGSDSITWTHAFTSPYEKGTTAAGGYKFWVDRSGNYGIFPAYSLSDSGVNSGQYNTQLVLNLNTGVVKYSQAMGHGDPGYGYFVGENTGYGDCDTCFKRWDYATLDSDPNPTHNNGTNLTSAMGYNIGRGYNNNFSSTNNTAVLVLACAIGGCPSTPDPYVGDVTALRLTGTQQTIRIARLGHLLQSGDYTELQPVMSPSGDFAAITTNFGTVGTNVVLAVRIP